MTQPSDPPSASPPPAPRRGRWRYVAIAAFAAILVLAMVPPVQRLFYPVVLMLKGKKTVDDRIAEFGRAETRVRHLVEQAAPAYPPARLILVGLKQERRLEVYAEDSAGTIAFVTAYPILAASGAIGPKLREGDRQVPEGIYELESLNPNSRFHVALRVSYPNAFDRANALADGRTNLGGDIMIHGNAVSIGCLAMGDDVAEELFILAARTGIANVQIIIAPLDLRRHALPESLKGNWRDELYSQLQHALERLPLPADAPTESPADAGS